MSREDPITQPQLGARGWARWIWRQLTSMRTALLLLLLLAVGAVPGSIFPQRSLDPTRTSDWIAAHPTAGPILDRLGFFEIYSSPWFSAIYLLLFISLVGCVLPRLRTHLQALRGAPPPAPRNLARLPVATDLEVDGEPEAVLSAAAELLRRRRMRVALSPDAVRAEGGFLRESGNLLFHLSLIGVLVGFAAGHLWGWKGDAIVPVGETFAKTRFDTFQPGPWVGLTDIGDFTITVDKLDVKFEQQTQGRGQFGMPREFTAHVSVTDGPGDRPHQETIEVNHPLELGGATAFLLGNGYAPVITVRDAEGKVLYHEATPFLVQGANYRSVGAIKVPAASPQLGFSGLLLPTAVISETQGPISVFPDALDPALALTLYTGELYPTPRPQSVYLLDTEKLTQVTNAEGTDALRIWLTPGQTYQLPNGLGSITFDKVERYAGLSVRNDPGKWLTLISALLALAGLVTSLLVHRRRIFVRVAPGSIPGRTVVSIGALAKDDDVRLPDIVDQLAAALGKGTE